MERCYPLGCQKDAPNLRVASMSRKAILLGRHTSGAGSRLADLAKVRYDKIVDNRDIVASLQQLEIMKNNDYGKLMQKAMFPCIFKEEEKENLVWWLCARLTQCDPLTLTRRQWAHRSTVAHDAAKPRLEEINEHQPRLLIRISSLSSNQSRPSWYSSKSPHYGVSMEQIYGLCRVQHES